MPPQRQHHRRGRPLYSSPEPPFRVPAAGRWIRSSRSPPEFAQINPRVSATPGGTLGASLKTWEDAQPHTIATVVEHA